MLEIRASGDVMIVTLARPDSCNALNRDMLTRMCQVLEGFSVEPPKVCILTGQGSAFCAGGDLVERQQLDDEQAVEVRAQVVRLFELLMSSPTPIIAAVNGPARGGGFELALACDFIVASERASFGLPEVGLGLMPGGGGTQTLVRAIGIPLAREIILLGRILSSSEALIAGLAVARVPHGTLLEHAKGIAERIAAQPAASVLYARQALAVAWGTRADEGLRIESTIFESLRRRSAEARALRTEGPAPS